MASKPFEPLVVPHPFLLRESGPNSWEPPAEHVQMPRTIVENRMITLSWALRQKLDWQSIIKNDEFMGKWRQKALENQENVPMHAKLTEKMIDYTVRELHSYATLVDSTSGVTHACDDAVFWSKSMVPDTLKATIFSQVRQLEGIPEEAKEWHSDSRDHVLDPVDPSLYPIVYGKSYIRKDGKTKIIESPSETNTFTSPNFCWIPSDFAIAEDGTAKLISPYINNIHPSNISLMNTIEKLVTVFVPMWERVLGSVDRRERPDRLGPDERAELTLLGRIPEPNCIWGDDGLWDAPRLYLDEDESEESNYSDFEGDEEDRYISWLKSTGYSFTLPDAPEQYDLALEKNFRKANLKGNTLQVIVKLTNIVLTPDNPEYEGESWRVDGMLNERIVSIGIYYYDSSNITSSHLSFRTGIHAPAEHCHDDHICTKWLYDLDSDSSLLQERGSVPTEENTCIGFPNIYQHRASSFKLADLSTPGHMKMVVLFLVDPFHRISSATEVGMQQEDWIKELLHLRGGGDGNIGISSRFGALPVEIMDGILDKTEGLISRKEAKEIRLELMSERTRFIGDYNREVMSVELSFSEN
ncbi:hypothetical protein DL96DRAFT_1826029 [Flagelloscypha sp. PMI_526]|nr:hypothetical protein DL96DRAFT_1826029 [Flagelloscypha sp. PMI_526]